ncbi:hypothetical protein D3C72_1405740 [compost metagenome]
MFLVDLEATRIDGQRAIGLAGKRAVRAQFGGQDQPMVSAVMLEEVCNAILFGQALDEMRIGLAMLHLPGELWIHRGVEALLHRERVVRKHLVKNLDHRLLLERLEVRRLRREPQPGTQREPVQAILRNAADMLNVGDDAGDLAMPSPHPTQQAGAHAIELDGDGHLAADHRIGIGLGKILFRGRRDRAQVYLVGEEFAQSLMT